MSLVEEAPAVGTDELRLHVDDDASVWYGHDNVFVENSRCRPEVFLDRLPYLGVTFGQCREVRLLGTAANAELLTRLWLKRKQDVALAGRQKIVVVSPASLPSEASRRRPRDVLQALWQPPEPLLGFPHAMDHHDYVAYALLSKSLAGDTEACRRTFRYHPAWPAFKFLPTMDMDAAQMIACHIVDPRWFRHHSRPHRTTKLYQAFGLTPQNARYFLGGSLAGTPTAEPAFNSGAAGLLLGSWYAKGRRADPGVPGNFLYRILAGHADPCKGILAAGKALVRFVYEVWSAAVGRKHPEAKFCPRQFFRSGVEVAAWEHHLEHLGSV